MKNSTEWSFDKPKNEGFYMINSGDVVTESNMEPVKVFEKDNVLYIKDFSGVIYELSEVHSSFKYLNISKLSKDLDP
jgi:hypothetical protein